MKRSPAILTAGLIVISFGAAAAEDPAACTSFAWSVARERTVFAAPELPTLASGSALPGTTGAARLVLKPAAEAALPIPSEKAMKPDTFAGFVTATIQAAGTYQITLSNDAWVDVSQNGRSTLKPTNHSGKVGCPDVRKSLRFAFDAGPVTIALSRTSDPEVKLDLYKVE